jgi:hypothetical protein
MGECICRIEKAVNGFEVEMYDPAVAKANAKSKGSWKDPMVTHVFNSMDDMLKFIKANLPAAGPEDEYGSSFDAMVKEEDDDE